MYKCFSRIIDIGRARIRTIFTLRCAKELLQKEGERELKGLFDGSVMGLNRRQLYDEKGRGRVSREHESIRSMARRTEGVWE